MALSTLVTRGHMSGDTVDTCPAAELYGDVRDNQEQQEGLSQAWRTQDRSHQARDRIDKRLLVAQQWSVDGN